MPKVSIKTKIRWARLPDKWMNTHLNNTALDAAISEISVILDYAIIANAVLVLNHDLFSSMKRFLTSAGKTPLAHLVSHAWPIYSDGTTHQELRIVYNSIISNIDIELPSRQLELAITTGREDALSSYFKAYQKEVQRAIEAHFSCSLKDPPLSGSACVNLVDRIMSQPRNQATDAMLDLPSLVYAFIVGDTYASLRHVILWRSVFPDDPTDFAVFRFVTRVVREEFSIVDRRIVRGTKVLIPIRLWAKEKSEKFAFGLDEHACPGQGLVKRFDKYMRDREVRSNDIMEAKWSAHIGVCRLETLRSDHWD